MLRRSSLTVAVGMAVLLSGCAHMPPEEPPSDTILELVPLSDWPELVDDLQGSRLVEACVPSVAYLERVPADRVFSFGKLQRTAAELADGVRRACQIAMLPPAERDSAFKNEFLLLRSTGRDGYGEVFFTGYYEPLLDARRNAAPPFVHPVYGVPGDLVTADLADFEVVTSRERIIGRVENGRLVPYPERGAIDSGAGFTDDVEVLGWVDDPVDVFFLQVQGSGTLVFEDGERLRAGYATTNGRPYRSIGRLLIDDGLVSSEDMSMQAIRTYLREHPDDLGRVLGYNPSFVFFRPLPSDGGPLGCYGEPVTGGRSIATDRRLFSAPVMAWINTTVPSLDGSDEPLARFVLNQDTGGSITGPGRVDLFFGQGDKAGQRAGRTKHLGELYFLIPKAGSVQPAEAAR